MNGPLYNLKIECSRNNYLLGRIKEVFICLSACLLPVCLSGIVGCTCSSASLEVEFRNGVCSKPHWSNSLSIPFCELFWSALTYEIF